MDDRQRLGRLTKHKINGYDLVHVVIARGGGGDDHKIHTRAIEQANIR